MTLFSALSLAAAMLILAASPGPGVFATIARALASGFKPALAVVCGIVLGDIIYLLFAAFGMAFVAKTMGELFFVVKLCGGAYLVFLGIRIWFSEPVPFSLRKGTDSNSQPTTNFLGGVVITLSNPKVILFYCGFLPTFLDLSALTISGLLGAVIIVSAVLGGVMTTYAYLADRFGRMLTSRTAVRRLNRTAGGVMAAAGMAIASR